MPPVTIKLEVNVTGLETCATSRQLDVSEPPDLEGVQYFLEESIAHLQQEIRYADLDHDLPTFENFFTPGRTSVTASLDSLVESFTNVSNKRALWFLVDQTNLYVRLKLLRARGYHEAYQEVDEANASKNL